jgi:hypothetical protein
MSQRVHTHRVMSREADESADVRALNSDGLLEADEAHVVAAED